jgi:hypothetical protein
MDIKKQTESVKKGNCCMMLNKCRALGLVLATLAIAHQAAAQTAPFTGVAYLHDGGQPANGLYDLSLTLFDSNVGGHAVTGSAPLGPVLVRNGALIFTIYPAIEAFLPAGRWLEVGVRRSGSSDPYTSLSLRQLFVPDPVPAGVPLGDGMVLVPGPAVEVDVVGRRPGAGNGQAATVQKAQRRLTPLPSVRPGQPRTVESNHPNQRSASVPAPATMPNLPPGANLRPSSGAARH